MTRKQTQTHLRKGYLILIALFTILFTGCRKDLYTNSVESKANQIEKAKKWYNEKQVGSSNSIRSSKGLSVLLTFEPEWDKAEILDINGTSIIIMSVKTNLEKLNTETEYSLLISEKANKYEYKTVAVKKIGIAENKLSSKDLYLSAFTEKNVSNATGNEITIFGEHFKTEKIALYDNSGVHLTTNSELNKINNAKREKTKLNGIKTDVTVDVTVCIDYYLVTQFYDENDNFLYETSRFLRTECETRQIDFIDNDPNGGTGGGSTSTDSAKVVLDFGTPVDTENSSVIETSADSIRSVKYYWTFHEANTYKFKSREIGYHKLHNDGQWRFAELYHDTHYVVGIVWGGDAEIDSFSYSTVLGEKSSRIDIEYKVRLYLQVKGIYLYQFGDYEENWHNCEI